MTALPSPAPGAYAFSYANYRFFWFALSLTSFAVQIVSVSVGWQIYDITRDPLYLGFVGLVQFVPALVLVLVTGLVADRVSRRLIWLTCLCIEVLAVTALLIYANVHGHEIWPFYLVLLTMGIARAFVSPATSSLAPNLVPPVALANAVSLNAMAWQLASIIGPVAGGLLYGIGPNFAYGTAVALLIAALACVSQVKPPAQSVGETKSLDMLFAGFRYIFKEKVVLGAISLDLFAVLLGGAVALMPVFARDILEVGPWGLGLLRAAPGVGAIITALWLARYPIRNHAGIILFVFVAGFGLFTALFGMSNQAWLSIPLLALIGACDMVSVSIRETIMQLWTPDSVRGRVNAVNSVFIGASNELGEFRAGVMAAFIGTQAAVTLGGFACMGVAVLWSQMFPGLRRQKALDRRMVDESAAPAEA